MPNFVSLAASIAEQAHAEKLRTHSLTQSLAAPGTEALLHREKGRPKVLPGSHGPIGRC